MVKDIEDFEKDESIEEEKKEEDFDYDLGFDDEKPEKEDKA